MMRAFVASLLALSIGCASLRTVVAPSRDYADYREFRLARGFGDKLSKAWRYLRAHPNGTFKQEVAAWFFPEEQRFWTEAGRTPGGAAAYLELLPDGPHAEEERTFLRAFEIEQREAPLREKRALEEARKKAEAARKALGEAVEAWTRRALTTDLFQQPRSVLDEGAFGDEYVRKPPPPICDDDGCSKFLTFVYPVPEANTALDRTVVLEVRVETAASLVTAITLVLPKKGFLWWLEGSEARLVDPNDPATRSESIVLARNRIEKLVRAVHAAPCTTTEADEARVLDCGDVRVGIGTTPAGDDVVRIVGIK